jgi:hypothetical protein
VVPPSFDPGNRSDAGKDTTLPEFDWPVILSRTIRTRYCKV